MCKYPEVASLENISQISASVLAPRQIFEIFPWRLPLDIWTKNSKYLECIFYNIDRYMRITI